MKKKFINTVESHLTWGSDVNVKVKITQSNNCNDYIINANMMLFETKIIGDVYVQAAMIIFPPLTTF